MIWRANLLGQPVVALNIPPDETLAAAGGSRRQNIALMDMEDGSSLGRPSLGGNARSVSFSPDSTMLAATASFMGIKVWRIPDRSLLYSIPTIAASIPFSPDGELLASGGGSGVNFYRAADGSLVETWNAGNVSHLMYSPDGALLATAADSSAKIWRVSDGALLQTLVHGNAVSAIAFSPDSLVLGTTGREAKLWAVADGALL